MEPKAQVFLGSSSESVGLLRLLETALTEQGLVTLAWPGTFVLARNSLDELVRLAHRVAFAVFVWGPDAMQDDRGRRTWVTRDNVIYEAGLFAGILGEKRVFLVVDSGFDIKMPSDYLGIGYASCTASDAASIALAAGSIRKAIELAEQEAAREDFTRNVEGVWTDAVVSSAQQSVISGFELRRTGPGALAIVNGHAWDPNGNPRAEFSSTSSRFHATNNTLTYSWKGTHTREPRVSRHFGVGELEFNSADPARASGWFSSTPDADPRKTRVRQRACRRASAAEAIALLSDDRQARQEAVRRLLAWREGLR